MHRIIRFVAAAGAALAAAPAAAQHPAAEIHTFHCLHGCPVGAAETNDLVVREIYTLSSNDLSKFADWVAYRVTKETIGPSGGRAWKPDPWLAPEETLEDEDYEDANAALRTDRGHQAPLAAFSGTAFPHETNYHSNATPQKSDLNQGSWMHLEGAERKLAEAGTIVFVLTGPLYERAMPALPKADEPHRIPSGYWKVIAAESDGRTRLSAFLFEQETPRRARYCDKRETIEVIERRALLRLFPRLAARDFDSLDAELGCP